MPYGLLLPFTKKLKKRALILCRDHRLNESLKLIWRDQEVDADVVNTLADAQLWWLGNAQARRGDFQIVLVTLSGRGRDYWWLFLNVIDEEHLPPVEIDI